MSADQNPDRLVFGEAINQKSVRGGDISKDVYYCRQGDLKLIYRADTEQWELYNLRKGPRELENIAETSEEATGLKDKLKPRIRRWIK